MSASVRRWVLDTVITASLNDPRSLQRELGPSGLGEPCDRRLAYHALDWPQVNPAPGDVLPPLIGKAVHAWLDAAFTTYGGPGVWTERRVTAAIGLAGSSDALREWDLVSDDGTTTRIIAVIDWKVVGPRTLGHARRGDIRPAYRVQANTYGLGFENEGITPTHVVIVFIPRDGQLADLHVHTERYDRQMAVDALRRWHGIVEFVATADLENHPARFAVVPMHTGSCRYCPWHRPGSTDLGAGCPGSTTPRTERTP